MAFSIGMPWSHGEHKMHELLHVPEYDNPTSTSLTAQASFMLQRAPLLAFGTLDSQDRPWTTLWGGHPGFSQPLGGGMIGTRTIVDGAHDPVVQSLTGGVEKGEMIQNSNRMLSGLAIDLMTRKRVKIAGHMVAGALGEVDVEYEDGSERLEGGPDKQDQLQLVYKVDQSLGNCPKYLNQYEIQPALVTSKVKSTSASLSAEAKALVLKSDMFFLSSTTTEDMDTNHRGGPQGFVRVLSDTEIVYPEYSGNRLYQTLGNLQMNPRVGITFPDYQTGDILYITGVTEILVLSEAAKVLPGSNLAVKIKIEEAKFVESGLPFRGKRMVPSPYNPLVRTLATEGNIKSSLSTSHQTARLVRKTKITPTISRFTFSVEGGVSYKPGQWVALDFSKDMDYGYSHMRDDDPRSLNDDFVRTFTISSTPGSSTAKDEEFDITIREVGVVTGYLFRQNERAGFEVPIVGIGGEFEIVQEKGKLTPFIAGGVGITPLLGPLKDLDLSPESFRLLWTVREADADLVVDTLKRHPALAKCTTIFFTGTQTPLNFESVVSKLFEEGVQIKRRRLEARDLTEVDADTWYLCAAKSLRKNILAWLHGKKVVFEDFDY
ncbi:oxidoreductase-like protein [Aaosphaeria arxii CBS 175.79]|uniref:Oxidoreductase-like protein n=1 Tax=Aaosphaeria arxii CBS 175.79 TaxID=1450172 RepID=A0A6A5X9C5_9PLEO|nr:oxidoreductase-like protein [Aaosphaeria arxii CBS 175.79]KAF2009562.1 oxidoreductase-like protein [Aaosphaeria arxii CBS 175.79]